MTLTLEMAKDKYFKIMYDIGTINYIHVFGFGVGDEFTRVGVLGCANLKGVFWMYSHFFNDIAYVDLDIEQIDMTEWTHEMVMSAMKGKVKDQEEFFKMLSYMPEETP